MTQSKAKIFLESERGINQAEWFCSYNTFNFGNYQQEHKAPFGSLTVLNDDEIAGGRSASMLVEDSYYVIILPVAGAVIYADNKNRDETVAAGQALMVKASSNLQYKLTNPFAEDLINVLHIWMKAGTEVFEESHYSGTYTNVSENLNILVPLFSEENSLPFKMSIGKFSGRGETTYQLSNTANGLFLFVLAGAFEADGRLLHERDGLALWQASEAEMEALSNDAIVLCVELPLT